MSKISLGPGARRLKRLQAAALQAAADAMDLTMREAQQDARGLARWRTPGEQTHDGWRWTVTDSARKSIEGLTSWSGNPRPRIELIPARQTVVTKDGYLFSVHKHYSAGGLVVYPSVRPGVVTGFLTMHVNYGRRLQEKEVHGAVWGIPDGGEAVTREALLAGRSGYIRDLRWRFFRFVRAIAR